MKDDEPFKWNYQKWNLENYNIKIIVIKYYQLCILNVMITKTKGQNKYYIMTKTYANGQYYTYSKFILIGFN